MLPVTRSTVRSTIAVFGTLALTLFLLPRGASAQFTTASLGGTVRDASGAGIPDATVSVLNVGQPVSLTFPGLGSKQLIRPFVGPRTTGATGLFAVM